MIETRNEDMEYVITCHVPICPHCGGALDNKRDLTRYMCNDCGSVFDVIKPGQAEHEMICKEKFFKEFKKEESA
ncbi:MAG: hypothetical protein IKR19_08320 [Acholeplasmatales bacterium]|nr:hypothetical protein [Acholeplasmatales bacterium]